MHLSLIWATVLATVGRRQRPRRDVGIDDDRGQATVEYALVLLAAALVGAAVVAWAAGGGASAIGGLFDRAIQSALSQL